MDTKAVTLGAALAVACLWGCSAIVSPDPSRLGGGSGTDAGRFVDAPGLDAFSMGCASPCDDGVACTVDSCDVSVCRSVPDDGRCAPTESCTAGGCVPRMCAGAEVCGNGVDDDCNPATSDVCPTSGPDDCARAEVVDLSSGSAVVRGDFGALRADYPTYCIEEGRRAGRDAVYRLDLGMGVADIVIETVGSVDTVLSVGTECGAFAFPACNDDQRPGVEANARLWLHPTAGTIYVLVSAFDAEGGPYEVRFSRRPRTTNECGDGALDVTGGGTVIGITLPPSRVTGTCMPDGSRELQEATLRFDGGRIERLRAFASFPAFLHVRSSCDLTDEETCARGTDLGGGASLVETNVRSASRRLYVFVDGASRTDQPYALFVEP